MNLKTTEHARIRLKERNGIPKSAIVRMTERVYTNGIKREDTKGRLRIYLDEQYDKNGGFGDELRVYGDYLYVFHEQTLITVFTVPQDIRKYIKFNRRTEQ